jgi:antitoxin PrlF
MEKGCRGDLVLSRKALKALFVARGTRLNACGMRGSASGPVAVKVLVEVLVEGRRGRFRDRVHFALLLIKCKARSHRVMEATLSSKNQATIPKAVREYLHLKPGDRFRFFFQPDGAVVILPKIPTSALKGSVPKSSQPVSVTEMDAAIEAGATNRFR